jgi:DNA-formamidopyrimidine glycosylase
MPELPEVETVRASLARDVIGKKVKSVTVTNGRIVRRHKTAKDFRAMIEGHSIRSAQRLGKNLVFALENGTHLVIHLGMSGQLLRAKGPKDPKPKHTHVVFTFVQGGELRYVDPRTFGELYISTPPLEGEEVEISKFARLSIGGDGLALRKVVPELAHLGIDPFEDQIGWDRFAAILRSRSTSLKVVLTDQDIIRHRQHLRRRDPLRRRTALRPRVRIALDHRDPSSAPRDLRDPDRSDQARRLDAGRRAVRRPRRRARHLPTVPSGLQPRRPGVLPVSPADRARNGARTRHVLLPEMPVVTTGVSPDHC